MITGFKCFNRGLVNRYGEKFEPGIKYHAPGEIKYHQNGFHMCANLEDTLRYFDAMNDEVEIARVLGFGSIDTYDDEYNGFYDMYATEYMEILQVLSHDEIINYALKLTPERVKRFISLFKLTKEEQETFKGKFNNPSVLMTLEYYQNNNDKVYQKRI